MRGRNPSTPLKALQTVYDRAVSHTGPVDQKLLDALERVRTHFGLKEFPR